MDSSRLCEVARGALQIAENDITYSGIVHTNTHMLIGLTRASLTAESDITGSCTCTRIQICMCVCKNVRTGSTYPMGWALPIDSPCECEHNNPDSLDARLFFTVVLAVAPAVTMDEASSLSLPTASSRLCGTACGALQIAENE